MDTAFSTFPDSDLEEKANWAENGLPEDFRFRPAGTGYALAKARSSCLTCPAIVCCTLAAGLGSQSLAENGGAPLSTWQIRNPASIGVTKRLGKVLLGDLALQWKFTGRSTSSALAKPVR